MKTFNLDPKVRWCCYYWRYQVCSDNKEKLTRSVKEEQNGKESKDIDNGEDDNEEDGDQLEENQEEEIGEEEPKEETTNQVFWFDLIWTCANLSEYSTL